MSKNITLTLTSCLEVLPAIPEGDNNPYGTSTMLLARTLYGSFITCYYRIDAYGIGRFQPISESRPYSISEITWWASLEQIEEEQHDGDKL